MQPQPGGARSRSSSSSSSSHAPHSGPPPPPPAAAAASGGAPTGTPEWTLLWQLYCTSPHDAATQEALCGQLLSLPAPSVCRYLLQLVYLAVARPCGPLERTITRLCGRCFNIALQVSWLLLALLQDAPANAHVRAFKDACERAALGGTWMSPFEQLDQQQQQLAEAGAAPRRAQSPPAVSSSSIARPTSPSAAAAAGGADGDRASAEGAAGSPASSPGGSSSSLVCAPPRGPGTAAASGSRASLDVAHRFRHSLDLELMRQTSSQDLRTAPTGPVSTAAAAAAGATEGSAAGAESPSSGAQTQQQQQQQQLSKLKTRPEQQQSLQQQQPPATWSPLPGSAAAAHTSLAAYLAARRAELVAALGPDEGVSSLIEASADVAAGNGPEGVGWLVSHDEELGDCLSLSMLLAAPPRSPGHAASRDAYLATLDFVEALCETSSSLTRFTHAERGRVLRECLARISSEVEAAAAQGVSVRYPIGGCTARVLRLLVGEAAILNSRDKAPFLLLLETQDDRSPLAADAAAAAAAAAADTHAQQQQEGESSGDGSSGSHSSGHHHHHSRAARHEQHAGTHHASSRLSRSTGGQDARARAAGNHHQQQQQQQAELQQQQAELHSQTQLEVQMQEAAALLRGESGAQLVRLQVAVLDGSSSSSSSSSSSNNGRIRPGSSQRKGGGDSGGRLVSVTLQVLAPAVPQLALPAAGGGAAKGARLRRRLPSQEAIDIIAGKMGRAALPDPVDIGPPLHLGGACDSTDAAERAAAAHVSPSTAPDSSAERPHASSQQQPQGADAAADSAADSWHHVHARPPAVQPLRQQQVPPASPTLWGRLFGSASSLGLQQQPSFDAQPSPAQVQAGLALDAAAAAERSAQAAAVFGDSWSKVVGRTAAASPDGCSLPGWRLAGAIIKSGDDCRQELLALQLIRELAAIWAAAALPLWLRPFDVLVTSSDTALIELIPDAISVHTVKARYRRLLATTTTSSSMGAAADGAATSTSSSIQKQQRRSSSSSSTVAHAAGKPPTTPHKQQQQEPLALRPGGRNSWSGRTSSSGSDASGGGGEHGSEAAAATAAADRLRRSSTGSVASVPPSPSSTPASPSGASSSASGASLSDFFFARWQRGSPECLQAQRRFVESLAGYSLVTYLLQVKDRHNGNIMLDAAGRLIHIDYGFMLSNTPGGGWVRFEASPMKLTREVLEVMESNSEGSASELFDYFKVLCIQGFLAARKERQRIVGLVRIMAECCRPPGVSGVGAGSSGSGSSSASPLQPQPPPAPAAAAALEAPLWPCFKAGPDKVVAALEARFLPGEGEAACVQHVLGLISTSLDAWSTRTYDYYQRVLNGIL